MKKILFITSNEPKVAEARKACEMFDIEVEQAKYDIDEIQSDNPAKISEHKARAAFALAGKPLVATDTFWSIPSLNGFPGAYMKEATQWFSAQDFINLLSDKDDKRIMFSENITYIDETQIKVFSKEFWGNIVPPRGRGVPIEEVAEFDGVTLGEHRVQGSSSHKPEDYVWVDFAKWFTNLSSR